VAGSETCCACACPCPCPCPLPLPMRYMPWRLVSPWKNVPWYEHAAQAGRPFDQHSFW
jgi:hypothetical protein